jgi:hypothetical protein
MPVICVALALLSSGCGEDVQVTEELLYQTREPGPQLAAVRDSVFTDSVPVGPEGKKAVLRVNWTVGRDTANCLRIGSVRVDYVGGASGLEFSNVKHKSQGCGMNFESADTTRFETAYVTLYYEARKGVQTYEFSGPVAAITGTGELKH